MKKFVCEDMYPSQLQDYLNEMSAKGYETVESIVPVSSQHSLNSIVLVVLSREVPNESENEKSRSDKLESLVSDLHIF